MCDGSRRPVLTYERRHRPCAAASHPIASSAVAGKPKHVKGLLVGGLAEQILALPNGTRPAEAASESIQHLNRREFVSFGAILRIFDLGHSMIRIYFLFLTPLAQSS